MGSNIGKAIQDFKDEIERPKTGFDVELNVRYVTDGNAVLERKIIANVGSSIEKIWKLLFKGTNMKRNGDTCCMVAKPVYLNEIISDFEFIRLEEFYQKKYLKGLESMQKVMCNVYLSGGMDIEKNMEYEYCSYRIKFELSLGNCKYGFSDDSVCVLFKVNFKDTLNELREAIFMYIVKKNGKLKDEFKRYNINWNDIVVIYRNRELMEYGKSIFDNLERESYYVNQVIYCKGILIKNYDESHSIMKSNRLVVNIYVEYNKYCYAFVNTYVLRLYFNNLNLFIPIDIVGIIKRYFMDNEGSKKVLNFGYITVTDPSPKTIQHKIISQIKHKTSIDKDISYIFPFKKCDRMIMRYYKRINNYEDTIGRIISDKESININYGRGYLPQNFMNILLQKIKQPKTVRYNPI